MEEKRSSGRAKRPAKPADEGSWDCSVCTYKNSAEAYKCEMCDVRKGTSTRKPRINPQLVAQQVAQQFATPLTPPPGSPTSNDDFTLPVPEPIVPAIPERLGPPPPPPPKTAPKKDKTSLVTNTKRDKSITQKSNTQTKKKARASALRDIDRSSARQMSVTVDNVTVVITDYLPKKRKVTSEQSKNSVQSDTSDSSSNASNDINEENSLTENHT